jgi:hypothetical protein
VITKFSSHPSFPYVSTKRRTYRITGIREALGSLVGGTGHDHRVIFFGQRIPFGSEARTTIVAHELFDVVRLRIHELGELGIQAIFC